MTRFARHISGATLLLLAPLGAGCRDPQPTYSFDAGAPGGSAGGKAGAAGGAAGRGGVGGGTSSGGVIGTASGGFIGTSSGGVIGTGSGGFIGTGSGGTTGGGGGHGGGAGGRTGTGGATPGSGGQTGTGNAPGSGGATPGGGTTGSGGANGGAGGGVTSGGGVGGGAGGGAGGSSTGGQIVLSDAALEAAADFELNSDGALAAILDCDPMHMTANPTIVDSKGNSWGPKTLPSTEQQNAFANLVHAIFQSVGTSDASGPGPGGAVGLHGWPDLNPRKTGVATNAANTAPGNRAINGGLVGFGAKPSDLTAGTLNGELAPFYKAAAIADGLKDSSGNPLTLSSTNAAFGAAISPISTNVRTAIGLANNIVQCAFTISIGVDEDGTVLLFDPATSTFTHNVVEDL